MPSVTPAPSSTPSEDSETEDSERYAEEDSNLQFEWGELFDAVALGASYAWLCCGVITVLSIPVLFVILSVASRRRQQKEDDQQKQDD
jgi:heme exporter protein D